MKKILLLCIFFIISQNIMATLLPFETPQSLGAVIEKLQGITGGNPTRLPFDMQSIDVCMEHGNPLILQEVNIINDMLIFFDSEFDTVREYRLRDAKYFGEMIKNQRQGKGFSMRLNRFEHGYWVNDQLHGSGVAVINEIVYKGNFFNGRPKGVMLILFPEYFYEGEVNPDLTLKGGVVRLLFESLDIYVGECKIVNNKPICEGKGTRLDANGNVYTGDWKNDKKHGKGIEITDDGYFEVEYDDNINITRRPKNKEDITEKIKIKIQRAVIIQGTMQIKKSKVLCEKVQQINFAKTRDNHEPVPINKLKQVEKKLVQEAEKRTMQQKQEQEKQAQQEQLKKATENSMIKKLKDEAEKKQQPTQKAAEIQQEINDQLEEARQTEALQKQQQEALQKKQQEALQTQQQEEALQKQQQEEALQKQQEEALQKQQQEEALQKQQQQALQTQQQEEALQTQQQEAPQKQQQSEQQLKQKKHEDDSAQPAEFIESEQQSEQKEAPQNKQKTKKNNKKNQSQSSTSKTHGYQIRDSLKFSSLPTDASNTANAYQAVKAISELQPEQQEEVPNKPEAQENSKQNKLEQQLEQKKREEDAATPVEPVVFKNNQKLANQEDKYIELKQEFKQILKSYEDDWYTGDCHIDARNFIKHIKKQFQNQAITKAQYQELLNRALDE